MLHHEFRIEGPTEPCQTCDLGIARYTTHDGTRICSTCLKRQADTYLPWATELLAARQTTSDEHSPNLPPPGTSPERSSISSEHAAAQQSLLDEGNS